MELDSGFYICKSFFVGIALSYYYALDADWIGDIDIRVFFYYDFYRLHQSLDRLFLENKAMLEKVSVLI